MKFPSKIRELFTSISARVILVFLIFFASFCIIYFTVDRFPSVDDPFFHIRFAEIIKERGLGAFTDFHWLYFSKISINQSYFVYYNFLFYLFLIPFTFIKPMFLGIKLYGVVSATVSFSVFFFFLEKTKVKNSFFWVIFLFSIINHTSILRFMMARPFSLAPAILLLIIYLAHKKKYWALFLLSIIYFFWHTATFFFPLMAVSIFFIFEAFYNKKFDWKLFSAVLSGTILSFVATLIFAPGLFSYLREIIFGVLYEAIVGKEINLAEGGEVYAINVFDFIKGDMMVIIFFVIACSFEIINYIKSKKSDIESAKFIFGNDALRGALFFLSLIFLVGTFLTRRNSDFFVLFSAAYIAMTLSLFFQNITFKFKVFKSSIVTGAWLVTLFFYASNLIFIHDTIASGGAYNAIEGSAEWLKKNTKKGEIIFNPTWNWFTMLFYYNTHNNYIAGLEPRFFYDYNSEMYWAWWNISNFGYLCTQEKCDEIAQKQGYALRAEERRSEWFKNQGIAVADYIELNFKSHYIITSKNFKSLNELLDNNSRFEKVFTDTVYNQYFVYRVN